MKNKSPRYFDRWNSQYRLFLPSVPIHFFGHHSWHSCSQSFAAEPTAYTIFNDPLSLCPLPPSFLDNPLWSRPQPPCFLTTLCGRAHCSRLFHWSVPAVPTASVLFDHLFASLFFQRPLAAVPTTLVLFDNRLRPCPLPTLFSAVPSSYTIRVGNRQPETRQTRRKPRILFLRLKRRLSTFSLSSTAHSLSLSPRVLRRKKYS